MEPETLESRQLHSVEEIVGVFFTQLWNQQSDLNRRIKEVESQEDWFSHYALGLVEETMEVLQDVE